MVVVLASLSLGSSACNLQWSPYAAKVGSKVITPATLDGALKQASSNSGFTCLLERSNNNQYRLTGAGTSTYDTSFADYVLTNLIDADVAHDIVVREGLVEPSGARTLASSQVSDALSSELSDSECGTSATDLLKQLKGTIADSFVQLQLDEDALAAHAAHISLTASGITSYELAHPKTTKETCISGLFAKTKKDATTVETKLKAGVSITSLASKYSPSQVATKGVLGCYTKSSLAGISSAIEKAVATAAVGSTSKPVSYEGAYLVMRVTSRPYEPLVDALDSIFTSNSKAFSSVIETGVKATHVEVNPEYGKWVMAAGPTTTSEGFGGRVEPNSGPATKYVLNPKVLKGPLEHAASEAAG